MEATPVISEATMSGTTSIFSAFRNSVPMKS